MGEVSGDDSFAAAIVSLPSSLQRYSLFEALNKLAFTMNALFTPSNPRNSKGVRGIADPPVFPITCGRSFSIVPQCYVIYTSFLKTEGLVFKDGYWLGGRTRRF